MTVLILAVGRTDYGCGVTDAPTSPPRAGRPRDETRDEAIRLAVLDLLAEVGFTRLTMDAVAARAGVGKATIYRRWDTKTDLVMETARDLVISMNPVPDRGDLRADLIELYTSNATMLTSRLGEVGRALLIEQTGQPEFAEAFNNGPMAAIRQGFFEVVGRAVERGELDAGLAGVDNPKADLIGEAGGSILCSRWLVTGEPMDAELVGRIVDDVVLPLLRRA